MEKLAFLFTGQGAQFVGMGKSFYDQYPIAKQTFEEANDVLGFDLANLCFNGNLFELTKTENAQPAIFTTSIAAYRVYMEQIGIEPQFCAGHSLGEYAALVSAGAISFEDGLRIVRQRGLFTKEIVDSGIGGMTIIDGLTKDIIERECAKYANTDKIVGINCYNSPTQYAIAGHQDVVEAIESKLLENNGQVTPLISSAPFHSALMQPVADKLKDELEKYTYWQFKYPVITNSTGKMYMDNNKVKKLLLDQMVKPVKWEDTMKCLEKYGVTIAIEMGPKNVLTNLVKANTPDIQSLCYAQKEDRKNLEELLSADMNARKSKPTVITRSLAAAVATPNTNWNTEEYNKGVVDNYKKIQGIQEELEQANQEPNKEQMETALNLLHEIFVTKNVSAVEQKEWIHQIIDETGNFYVLKDFEKSLLSSIK